jgi:hypothetical protein
LLAEYCLRHRLGCHHPGSTAEPFGADKAHLLVLFDLFFVFYTTASVMTHPQNLQIYANELTKDKTVYRNTAKLWEKLLMGNDRSLGPDIKRDTQRTVVNQKLLARIKAVVLDKSGPNRGHRDLRAQSGAIPNGAGKGAKYGSGKGNGKNTGGKSKGKGKGSGVPNLSEMHLAEDDLFLELDDGNVPIRFDADDLHEDATGFFTAGANEMGDILARQLTFHNPVAMIVKRASLRSITTTNQHILGENNSPQPCALCWREEKGQVHEVSDREFAAVAVKRAEQNAGLPL